MLSHTTSFKSLTVESITLCATGLKILTEPEPDRIGIILAGTGPEPDRNRTGLQARKS